MEILISNEQDVPVDEELLVRVARTVLEHEGVREDAELSIALVDEDTIRALNAHYRGKDAPTDVLSFESGAPENKAPEMPMPMPYLLGDVIICPSVAVRQADEYGQSFNQEMGLLVTHGILHLLGYDHLEETEAEAMEEREREILSRIFASDTSIRDIDDEK